jgi:exopolysaccharide biosynthesis protein
VKDNILLHGVKVRAESLVTDGALADFKFGLWIVVDVIDAHFIADGKSAQGYVDSIHRVVGARRDQGVSLNRVESF